MKKLLIVLLVCFVIIQFFRIDQTNPPVNKGMDFLQIKDTPESTATIIRKSCYDCHSNETRYPWYTHIQPVAWFMQSHIEEGRKNLNFSLFSTYEPKRQIRKLQEAAELTETAKMPLQSYVLGHPEAQLSDEERQELAQYFRQIEEDTRMMNNLQDYQ